MKVDRDVVASAPKLAGEVEVGSELKRPRFFRRDDHLSDVRIAFDDRCSGRLDNVCDVSRRKPLAQSANGRRCEYNVSDLAKADEENS